MDIQTLKLAIGIIVIPMISFISFLEINAIKKMEQEEKIDERYNFEKQGLESYEGLE